jgi:hypothetical protein
MMRHQERHRRTLWIMMALSFLWVMTLGGLSRGLSAGQSLGRSAHPTPFLVTGPEGLLSPEGAPKEGPFETFPATTDGKDRP